MNSHQVKHIIINHIVINITILSLYKIVSETQIGNIDVKTTEVHFYVQRTSSYFLNNAVIQFDKERLNIGGAMDMSTGIFSAPGDGIYQFEFNGIKSLQNSLYVFLQVNGASIGVAHGTGDDSGAFQLVLTLLH